MLNKAFLMGRLVADPELRHTQSGIAVASFRIAVDRDFKDKDTGERKADFINIVAWRSTAEFVSRYFAKGRMAVVEGRIQVRDYLDNNGNKRYATEIVADNVYFGDSKKDDGGGGYQQAGGYGGGYSQGGYDGGYGTTPGQAGYGGYNNPGGYGNAPGGYGGPPPSNASVYPPSNYSEREQFSDIEEDDGELPF